MLVGGRIRCPAVASTEVQHLACRPCLLGCPQLFVERPMPSNAGFPAFCPFFHRPSRPLAGSKAEKRRSGPDASARIGAIAHVASRGPVKSRLPKFRMSLIRTGAPRRDLESQGAGWDVPRSNQTNKVRQRCCEGCWEKSNYCNTFMCSVQRPP